MTPRQRKAFADRLAQLRTQLVADGPVRPEPTRKDTATAGVADEDEQALAEMMQILASTKNKKQSELLKQVDQALRKLADAPDDFGLCEACDEAIAPRRLELMPYATLCTSCQAERDPRRGVSRKSLTDLGE